jgi:outer membrane protein TolC
MSEQTESRLKSIRDIIAQANKLLDAGQAFDLTPIVALLEQVQNDSKDMQSEERDYIAQNLNDVGVALIELEDKINRNNSELTNMINSLDSSENS